MSTISTTQAAEADDHAAARRPQGRLTPRMAVQLAAPPHVAGPPSSPCWVALACAVAETGRASAVMACALSAICVLMQSAVNTFNDYYDYVKGADSADDDVDPTDAVLAYNDVDPRAALALAIGCLRGGLRARRVRDRGGGLDTARARLRGRARRGAGLRRQDAPFLSAHRRAGERVRHGRAHTAGEPIQALTGVFDVRALLWAVPTILGVGLIMMTKNTRDIEKDVEGGAPDAAGALGTRPGAGRGYDGLVFAWLASIVVLVGAFFPSGLLVVAFMLLGMHPPSERAPEEPAGAGGAHRGSWRRSAGST